MKPINYKKATWQERQKIREEYIIEQCNNCYFCGKPLNEEPVHDKEINWNLFPKNFLQHSIHLHHSHKTGLTLGAVHAYCNAVLWQYHHE